MTTDPDANRDAAILAIAKRDLLFEIDTFDPRLCWVETDGFAGRLSTPALLIEQGASACTVLLLARLKVNGRQWPAGVRKSVPAASVVRWPSVASTVLPIEFNPKEQPCQPEIPSPSPA